MDKIKRIKKRNITIISIFSVIGILVITFLFYWMFALVRVNNFTDINFADLKTKYDFIKLRQAEIHYVEKGSGNNTIILVHGLGGGTFSFRNNIDALVNAGYKVFAIDLKGFGFSEKVVGSDYSDIEQAEIILDFMDKKGIQKTTIAGHSMGGRIALICYDIRPQSFEKIILIDSAGLEENSRSLLSNFITKPLVDIIFYNLIVKENKFKDFLSSAFYNKELVNEEVVSLYLKPFKIKNSNLAYLYIIKSNVYYDIGSVLEKINIPVLIIWGESDSWINVENAYKFNALIKGSELSIIKDAGHVPMEEQAEKVNEKIIEFLKKI